MKLRRPDAMQPGRRVAQRTSTPPIIDLVEGNHQLL